MLIKIVSSSSILLPLIAAIICFKRLDNLQKVFFAFIIFSINIEILALITGLLNINNHWIFKLFLFTELVFFAIYFYKTLKVPIWLNLLSVLVLFFLIFIEKLLKINAKDTNFWFFVAIFIFFIIQSGTMLILLFSSTEKSFTKIPLFWIASARLLYFTFILFIYVYPNLANKDLIDKTFPLTFVIINSFANIFQNILYSKSFYAT